ncbi:MarR family winged helix-turn-helix transcriptional regulator [Aliikangiella sp. IMCC44359]|uniref:MarR family winged helix-turn-helix transcriptional regulator n=1 Tax=Aliikangiella sp. IMCC44359 TaxID=3459125 RepID=UPI00403AAA0C
MDIVARLFRLNRYLNILAQEAPFSVARLEVLRLIKAQNPITLRQLCDIQQVTMPTMSKLVDELQTLGFVIRAQSKDDARQRLIVPTQKGIQALSKMEEESLAFWQKKLNKLDELQQVKIEQALAQLVNTLKSD